MVPFVPQGREERHACPGILDTGVQAVKVLHQCIGCRRGPIALVDDLAHSGGLPHYEIQYADRELGNDTVEDGGGYVVLPAIVTMCVLARPICGLISGSYTFQESDGYSSAPYILMILASMMVTYSIGDIIYGQILLPMKKEKYYLIAIGTGTILNIVLSIILGGIVFKETPAIGVAIGTASTDLLIIIFLLAITWKWTKHALFNKNLIKLLIANAIIAVISVIAYQPLMNLWESMNLSIATSYVLQMLVIVFVDAIIYLVTLYLLKEDLVYSFSRKRREERKNAES